MSDVKKLSECSLACACWAQARLQEFPLGRYIRLERLKSWASDVFQSSVCLRIRYLLVKYGWLLLVGSFVLELHRKTLRSVLGFGVAFWATANPNKFPFFKKSIIRDSRDCLVASAMMRVFRLALHERAYSFFVGTVAGYAGCHWRFSTTKPRDKTPEINNATQTMRCAF